MYAHHDNGAWVHPLEIRSRTSHNDEPERPPQKTKVHQPESQAPVQMRALKNNRVHEKPKLLPGVALLERLKKSGDWV